VTESELSLIDVIRKFIMYFFTEQLYEGLLSYRRDGDFAHSLFTVSALCVSIGSNAMVMMLSYRHDGDNAVLKWIKRYDKTYTAGLNPAGNYKFLILI